MLGIVVLILAPGVTLGYFGFRAQAEREQNLRRTYTATTVLVRDRLAAEIERLESDLPIPGDANGLAALEGSSGWLQTPFILRSDGSVTTARLSAGTLAVPPDPIASLPRVAAIVAEAEHHEFLQGDLESALRLYRRSLTNVPNESRAAAAFIRSRTGRTLFKVRRFEEGIREYEAVASFAGRLVDRNGLPFTAMALMQIIDGYEALRRTDEAASAQHRFARFALEHPWDLDNGYRQYLTRAFEPVLGGDAMRAHLAAIEQEIAAIDWVRTRLHADSVRDPAGKEPSTGEVHHVMVPGDPPRLVAYRRTNYGSPDSGVITGYEVRLDRLGRVLLAQVLQRVDLGRDLQVAITEANIPRSDQPARGSTSSLAEVDLFPALPHWKVALSDGRGRSIAQLVARDRWTYGALVAGMLAVMATGVVLTLRASSRATQLARAKTDFVSSVSHELKTPLALIRMFGETLESGIVSDAAKQQEFYGIIRRESERLTHLIDNVLDANRIDHGTKRYEMRAHDLVETVHTALAAYRPLFERAGFTVDTAFSQVPIVVVIDREAIIQSLVNLFQNVIKYSRAERYVSVAIRVGDGTVSVSVTDRGIGIPADQIDRVFDAYYRVPQSDSDAVAGSGLGLAIVKHAIDAHGGRADIVSTPGDGTTVTLVLPFAVAQGVNISLPAGTGAVEAG